MVQTRYRLKGEPPTTIRIYQYEWIVLKTRFDSLVKLWISFAFYRRATHAEFALENVVIVAE